MKSYINLSFLTLLFISSSSSAQKSDSIKYISNFSGSVSVTNNGLSFIPTFSLGQPAAIFNLSLGNRKLSFEPEMRFSLEGKPWSFLFWWRYKLYKTDKFKINLGAHPALNFKTTNVPINGISGEYVITRRYLAAEIVPSFTLSKNISLGMYYLYSVGLDPGTTKNTHFLTLNTSFTNIRLAKKIVMRLVPQVYYLRLDQQEGYYYSISVNIARKNFPLSVSAIINKAINTEIPSKPFVWNTSLVYTFNQKYAKIRQAL